VWGRAASASLTFLRVRAARCAEHGHAVWSCERNACSPRTRRTRAAHGPGPHAGSAGRRRAARTAYAPSHRAGATMQCMQSRSGIFFGFFFPLQHSPMHGVPNGTLCPAAAGLRGRLQRRPLARRARRESASGPEGGAPCALLVTRQVQAYARVVMFMHYAWVVMSISLYCRCIRVASLWLLRCSHPAHLRVLSQQGISFTHASGRACTRCALQQSQGDGYTGYTLIKTDTYFRPTYLAGQSLPCPE